MLRVAGRVGGAGELNVSVVGGVCSMLLYVASLAEREPDLCRGTWGYIYVLSCLYVFTLLLLRSGGHCEWFCVSTGLSTGCG